MSTVAQFIDKVAQANELGDVDPMKRRAIRYKLGLADIKSEVRDEDTLLAKGIILAELKPGSGSKVKTASAFGAKLRPCPRCASVMDSVKLATSADAYHCASCHVTEMA